MPWGWDLDNISMAGKLIVEFILTVLQAQHLIGDWGLIGSKYKLINLKQTRKKLETACIRALRDEKGRERSKPTYRMIVNGIRTYQPLHN